MKLQQLPPKYRKHITLGQMIEVAVSIVVCIYIAWTFLFYTVTMNAGALDVTAWIAIVFFVYLIIQRTISFLELLNEYRRLSEPCTCPACSTQPRIVIEEAGARLPDTFLSERHQPWKGVQVSAPYESNVDYATGRYDNGESMTQMRILLAWADGQLNETQAAYLLCVSVEQAVAMREKEIHFAMTVALIPIPEIG